jgi:hypothetical protein
MAANSRSFNGKDLLRGIGNGIGGDDVPTNQIPRSKER